MKPVRFNQKYMLFSPALKIIEFPLAIDFWKKGKLRPTAYLSHSYYQARRLNIWQAIYYYFYLSIKHKRIRPLKIKNIPFFWWESPS